MRWRSNYSGKGHTLSSGSAILFFHSQLSKNRYSSEKAKFCLSINNQHGGNLTEGLTIFELKGGNLI